MACHECGTVHRVHSLLPGAGADCATCGATLYSRHRSGLDRILALYVTAAILFVLANSFPFMSLKIEGREQQTELASTVLALWHADMRLLATVVLACAVLLPAVKIVGRALGAGPDQARPPPVARRPVHPAVRPPSSLGDDGSLPAGRDGRLR